MTKALAAMLVSLLATSCFVYVVAQKKRQAVTSRAQPSDGRSAAATPAIIKVNAGGNLQAALNRARPGDTIILEAGATYRGPFVLPVKTGGEWITIRGNAADAQLPGP
ncbi:MAG: hypothetical protein ACR2G4_08450, partial [Pyrinomonadaceae bacterium]